MEYIDALASDIKNAIPAVDYYLEARGFKTVDMDNKRPSDQRAPTRQRSPEEANVGGGSVDSEQTKLDDDVKIVFHAPRGERKRHIGSSKCRNDFYESARRARARDPRQPVMEYEFRPTMEWYRDQIEEGRDYEHVHVGSWKSFFRTFGVGKGDTDLHVCP
ncbi:hypothetical protein SBRCBS47491_003816 [Sporothrix bragantina]|uniref:Uncharacterized protein n=1 Tax=Sporothrix bragantina TaxID=671064 RepID=A0ABP0BIN0_9PEZI